MRQPRKERERIGRFVKIYKRGRVYQADINFNGMRRRMSLETGNVKAARDKALDIDADLQRGLMPEKYEQMPLEDAVAAYLDYAEGEACRPKTLAKYKASLDCFLRFARANGLCLLDQVSLMLIERYKAKLRKADYAATTIAGRITIVKQLMRWAVTRNILRADPLGALKGKKPKPKEQPCYTIEQVETILSAANPRQRPLLEMLAFTGMRIGELQWLTWDDVDFERGFIRIRAKDHWVPKSGRSRVIPMHARVRKLLRHQPKNHRFVFTALKSKKNPDGGGQINPNHVRERLKRLLRPLGIEGHLHTFRHFFASHCAKSGITPFKLMSWLGHANVEMVMHYYALQDEESLIAMDFLSKKDALRNAESSQMQQSQAS